MRGLIISSEYSGNETSLEISGYIDPNKLRQYLLYWDKLDYPYNNAVYIESSPEVAYLEEANILKRTKYNFKGGIINNKLFQDMQIYAFNKNNDNSNGEIWSIAQPTKKIVLPLEESIKDRTLQIELFNSIPVPTAEVNLEDILNFKEHRYSELQEFRNVIDEMYLSIIQSPDRDLAKSICVNKLRNNLKDLDKVMNETKITRVLSGFKVELDISGLLGILPAIGGYTLGSKVGFPKIGAILGVASSMIKVSYELSLKPKEIPAGLKDYAYLYYQSKELL